MPNELSEKVYPDGTVVKLRDDAAREQIAGITDEMEARSVSVTWPLSGTMLERTTNIVTQILTGATFTKQFNVIDVLENNATNTGLGQFLYTNVGSGNYGEGIFFSYYTDLVCKVKNVNGTITVKQLIEDDPIKIQSLSIDVPAVSAGRGTVVSKALPVISGYKAVGIIGMSCLGNMGTLSLNDFFVNNTEAYVSYNNNTSSATTKSVVTLDLLYKKT